MSSAKRNNVETVLPATGSGSPANTNQQQDPKSYKQELKNRIATLKLLQKDTQKNLSAAQKELTKLDSKKSAFKTPKKELKIVKKGKNSKNK